jgi:prophage antirepressor-like protein
MSDTLMTFVHDKFGKLRTCVQDWEPWFCATDVCRALDFKSIGKAVNAFDYDDQRFVSVEDVDGNPYDMAVISAFGLYSLVRRSCKPEAKSFKKWVFNEVIPSLMKTRTDSLPGTPVSVRQDFKGVFTVPDVIIWIATEWKKERERRLLAEKEN